MAAPAVTLVTDSLHGEEEDYPRYKIGQVSSFFFGKSSAWLRWRDKQGDFDDIKWDVSGRRRLGDMREYRLDQVEQIILRLHALGVISDELQEIALDGVLQQVTLHNLTLQKPVYEGVEYPYDIDGLAWISNRPASWLRSRASSIGGVRRPWKEGTSRESWRFPESSLAAIEEIPYRPATRDDEDD